MKQKVDQKKKEEKECCQGLGEECMCEKQEEMMLQPWEGCCGGGCCATEPTK